MASTPAGKGRYGAGVHAVIAPKDRSVGLTATAMKVASGAAESIPYITVTNLARTLRELKDRDIWIVGADEEGDASHCRAGNNEHQVTD